MPQNLVIDIGNSRLKWAISDQHELDCGLPIINSDVSCNLLLELWQNIPIPNKLAISCVSTNQLLEVVISVANQLWPETTIIRIKSAANDFGIQTSYREPEKLGSDRWLALIAGYHTYQKPLCIVDCGTAITVDVIDATGKHLGGLIAPGLQLMKGALATGTENLELSDNIYPVGLADFTDAAIYNGAFYAACGLIEFVLKNQPAPLQLLLTGGDAKTIAAHLSVPMIIDSNLVLRGLALTLI